MVDGVPPTTASGMEDPARQPPCQAPPPLDAIRVKGANAKGLNKPAILIAAGTGVAIVLVLASGAFSSGPSRKPAETKPMMSDPARPEMAQGAIRALPADYTEAAARLPSPVPAAPPQLGPPLPGDIAAFAQIDHDLRGRAPEMDYAWDAARPAAAAAPGSIEEDEEQDAERSALFFALRHESQQQIASARPELQPLAPAPPTEPAASLSADRSLFPGAVIPASLVTELNSESPGPVIAQVTQSIYDSATGRNLLIPQGAKLIGDYKSSTRYGQSRVSIVWQRLIMPDGAERALNELAVSPNGAAGVSGKIDNHWGDVFGAAALGTLINVGVATTEDPQITFSGIGAVSRDPVDQAIQDGVQRNASTVTNRVVDRGLAIPPTIRVQAGARISVIVTRMSVF
ncbi:MAG: TrbI/VirB10 family protein [Alphaproteobacteria bacterium]|nr:MAG: TrbI/VirB10 family protein [Alphaproteobacteria bacterium]